MRMITRGWFEPWPRTSWQGAKEPELAILKYEIILSFQSIWLILAKYDHLWFWVTGIWAPTFLVKVVTHKLYFSGVTAFGSLSADLRSRLKPPSDDHPTRYTPTSSSSEDESLFEFLNSNFDPNININLKISFNIFLNMG